VLARFAEALSAEGVRIKLGHRAARVESIGLEVGVEFDNGHCETFDQVVLTMASPVAARICSGLSDREQELLNGIQYQGVICASLLLKRPLANYYVTNITDDWVPFTAVIEMSALVDSSQFGGNSLVYLPKYVPPDDPAFYLSDEAGTKFMEALLRMYPHLLRSDLLSFRVSHEKYVLDFRRWKYSEFAAPGRPPWRASTSSTRPIVNGTLNVNETIQLAEDRKRTRCASDWAWRADEAKRQGNETNQTACQSVSRFGQPVVHI
jgi:hypothetical protein